MSQFQHFICYTHVLLMLQHPRFPGNRVAFLSCKYGELDSQEHMHVHPWADSFIVHRPNYRTGLKTYLEKSRWLCILLQTLCVFLLVLPFTYSFGVSQIKKKIKLINVAIINA